MADFENLVDRIYEAAADADLWPQVLHDLSGAADAVGGVILTRRSDAWMGWRYSSAMAPGAEAYMAGPAAQSQSTGLLLSFNRAGFVDAMEAFPNEESYIADPLMTEWGTPAGLHHGAATAIHVPTGDFVVVQVNRRIGQHRFSRDDLARLDAFRPHLARASLLAARWRLQKLRAAAEALAMIGLPAAILDSGGRVLAANALIEAFRSHLLWLPKDRIALVDPAANELLRRAVAKIDDPAANSVRSFPAKGAAGDPVVVHLIPATGTARDLFKGGFCVLAMTPLAAPSAPDAALIQGLFDLTAAEARVAGGVAEGLTLDEIAARQGVTVGTVRSQIKSVFAKTGVARQAQLAGLLAAQTKIPWESSGHTKQSE
jgi:DNA-binding CsgD family transcriptional regulator